MRPVLLRDGGEVTTAPPHAPCDPSRALDLALRAGDVLLSGGASAAEVTAACTAVAEAAGLHGVECDITFTSLTLSGRPGPGLAPFTAMRLVHQRELDYSRVAGVHALVRDLVEGHARPAEAEERLAAIVRERHPYPRAVVTGARAALAASIALLLGAGPAVTGTAFGVTVVIDVVNSVLARRGLPTFYQNALGGLIATSAALGLVAAGVGVRPALVVAGGIVLLLPGVTLVGAVHDAITGFYVTAGARTFETFLLTAGIVSGIAVALSVGVRLGLPVRIGDPPTTGIEQVPVQLLAAAAASLSFAMANHAPRRTLGPVAAAGAVGWAVFLGLDRLQLSDTFGAATAAVVIGAGGYAFASRQRVPALVYVAAGIIPLLPGLAIYRGMRRLAEGDSVGGLGILAGAVATGLALAAGALLGEYVVQLAQSARTETERRLAGLLPAGAPRWRRRR